MVFCKEFGKKEKVFGINLGIDASKLLQMIFRPANSNSQPKLSLDTAPHGFF